MLFTPEKLKEMAKKASDEQALDLALDLEKSAVLFYTDMVGIAREQDKKVVDWVIGQEKMHVTRILDLKKMLQSGNVQEYGH